MWLHYFLFLIFAGQLCTKANQTWINNEASAQRDTSVYIVVLGTVQDAGSPQIACDKDCCKTLSDEHLKNRMVSSIAVVDEISGQSYIFDASPDLPAQLRNLKEYTGFNSELTNGFFITHAHIGHYTGLMYLGREAMNANKLPVYLMPRLSKFIKNNGPWSQLVDLDNIQINELSSDSTVVFDNFKVTPFLVPHRDEFSETVGFRIEGPNRTAIFIPDIDKWHKWDKDIRVVVSECDYAFLDATFYDNKEIPNRNISEIPHPFVIETMSMFDSLGSDEKSKIHLLHFNHTNPLLNSNSEEYRELRSKSYNISFPGNRVQL